MHNSIAIMDGRRLSNTVGTVLDPVFALRYRVRIAPGASVRISFWTAVASSRASALDLFDKLRDTNAFVRAATLAWTRAQVQLRHLGVTAEDANLFQRIAGHVLYSDASMRPPRDVIQRGGGAPAALWAQGISGDLPIVLLRIDHIEDIEIVRQLLRAHEYWQLKQLAVDLVILNERASSYVQDLQAALETLVRMSQSRPRIAANSAKGSACGRNACRIVIGRTRRIRRATRQSRRAARTPLEPGRHCTRQALRQGPNSSALPQSGAAAIRVF
jgi:cyclic beta-1,2-glucan synthetase